MGQFGTFGQGGANKPVGLGMGGPDPMVMELINKLLVLNGEVLTQAVLLADARRRVARLEAELALKAAGREARRPVEFRSQFGEDSLLWSLFGGKLEGFFIEVGAFDGYRYSTTYALEAVGWNGLLIEAIPERCADCAARRTGSRVVNAALGKKGSTGTATFTVVDDDHGGMLSFHTTDPRHLEDLRRGQFLRRSVTVPLTTMDALLESHPGGPPVVDAATIDVEGGEADLLDGFDLARWKPKVLLIEDNGRGAASPGREVVQKVVRSGYTHAGWFFVNGLFIHNAETELLQRAKDIMNPQLTMPHPSAAGVGRP